MATIIVSLIILGYLLVLSLIDLKKHEIPSVYTTIGILILAGVNVATSPIGLNYGILAFVVGWFLFELDFFAGLADIKVLTILGLLVADIQTFSVMIFFVVLYNLIYQIILKKFWQKKNKEDIAFIPVFFLTYLTIFLISLF
jgi:hypothetical protein